MNVYGHWKTKTCLPEASFHTNKSQSISVPHPWQGHPYQVYKTSEPLPALVLRTGDKLVSVPHLIRLTPPSSMSDPGSIDQSLTPTQRDTFKTMLVFFGVIP